MGVFGHCSTGSKKVLGVPKNICDGCRGKEPFEHKCHGENAGVLGFKTNKPCECRICQCQKEESHSKKATPRSYYKTGVRFRN